MLAEVPIVSDPSVVGREIRYPGLNLIDPRAEARTIRHSTARETIVKTLSLRLRFPLKNQRMRLNIALVFISEFGMYPVLIIGARSVFFKTNRAPGHVFRLRYGWITGKLGHFESCPPPA